MKKTLITIGIIVVLIGIVAFSIFQYNKYKEKSVTDILTNLDYNAVDSIIARARDLDDIKLEYTFENEDKDAIIQSLKNLKLHRTSKKDLPSDSGYLLTTSTKDDIYILYLNGNGKTIIFTAKDEDVGYYTNYEMDNSDFYNLVDSLIKKEK
ncbi:hypothetical protein JFL43_15750 [Viridibacillus sp. YIM B01967]|uniref:Uncharacterized protein n=1 Tax=Viridibacillus soli TaxID=2798301 RepID=A0ABS1HAI7_9BACL|nr:hypothetical protein [Viridibacillus soli]MBK3496289.1 hypothetical protein [Viridibacillus soli]